VIQKEEVKMTKVNQAKSIAFYSGAVVLIVGVLGLFFVRGSGMLFNIFQLNTALEIVYVVVGLALLYGSTSTDLAHRVASVTSVLFLALGVIGFFSSSLFGLLPLNGANLLAHLALGVVLAYDWLATPENKNTIIAH
jgi:Domain of unknown function (DUF4383)